MPGALPSQEEIQVILAFETSAKAASVALLEDGKLVGESYQNTGLTHSQTLLSMAETMIKSCGLKDGMKALANADLNQK